MPLTKMDFGRGRRVGHAAEGTLTDQGQQAGGLQDGPAGFRGQTADFCRLVAGVGLRLFLGVHLDDDAFPGRGAARTRWTSTTPPAGAVTRKASLRLS
jgi:hypothetical protein